MYLVGLQIYCKMRDSPYNIKLHCTCHADKASFEPDTLSFENTHILRRNCLLTHVIEGKIEGRVEVTKRRGRRTKQLLYDLTEKRGHCKLKEEAIDRSLWRTGFGRGCGPVVRQTT